jgi:hypothetical protein
MDLKHKPRFRRLSVWQNTSVFWQYADIKWAVEGKNGAHITPMELEKQKASSSPRKDPRF